MSGAAEDVVDEIIIEKKEEVKVIEASSDDAPEPIFAFCNYIYQIDPLSGKYEKVSKENGWSGSRFGISYNGLIYVISYKSGKIFAWNPYDKTYTTISTDDWSSARGFVLYKDSFYIICDKIYKMDPTNGQYQIASNEEGWKSIKMFTPYVYDNKIIMTDSIKGDFYAWNPEDGSYSTVLDGDWSTTNCFGEYEGKLYAFCVNVYEIDLQNGKYEKVSGSSGGWTGSEKCVVKNGSLYVLHKTQKDDTLTGNIWKFDPNDGESTKILEENWGSTGTII